jgi:hypothetical protein
LCSFDPRELKKALDEEIAAVEAQIAHAKAGSKQRQRERLAELVSELDDGLICELAAKKNAKLEAEITAKVGAKLQKHFEAEFAAKMKEHREQAAKKNAELELEITAKVEAKLRKEFEAEFTAKIGDAKAKMAAESKIKETTNVDAVKTIRKTKRFGVGNDTIKFEWPKQEDLMKMQDGKPIKVESISYRTIKSGSSDYISQI